MNVAALVLALASSAPAATREAQLDEIPWLFTAQVGYGGPLDEMTRRESPLAWRVGLGAEWSDGGANGKGVALRVDGMRAFFPESHGVQDELWALVAGLGLQWRSPRAPRWLTRLGFELGGAWQSRTFPRSACLPIATECGGSVARYVFTTPLDVLFRVNPSFAVGVSGRLMLIAGNYQDNTWVPPEMFAGDASLVVAFTISQ